MAETRTADLRVKLGALPGRVREWARLHRFWFESAGVTAVALLVLGLIGVSAHRRASAWERESERLRLLEGQMNELVAASAPTDSLEALEWERSTAVMRELVRANDEPLAMASLIAARAEEVGIFTTRVTLLPADTLEVPGTVGAGEWTAETRPPTIQVQFVEDLAAVGRFVGALPPGVEVGSLTLVPDETPLYQSALRLVARSIEGPL